MFGWDDAAGAGVGSALGIGSSAANMAISGSLNYKRSKQWARWQTKELYPMQLNSALDNYYLERKLQNLRDVDSVKNQREGLEAAGYNPLLAVDSVASGGQPVLTMPDSGISSVGGSSSGDSLSYTTKKLQNQQVATAEEQERLTKAEADSAEAQAAIDKANSSLEVMKIEAEKSALENPNKSGPIDSSVEVLDHSGWRRLRDNIRQQLETQGYKGSEARAIALDVIQGVKDVSTSSSALGLRRSSNSTVKHVFHK